MYVGVGARRVRDLASKARQHGRCIIFIDEFDSIGGKRGRPNRTSEEDLTLNQLLVEMDGMAGSEGIVWMAATNRDDMLDPAVRRPGRFDRVVEVGMPTAADRLEILKVHAAKRPLDIDVDLQELSTLTVGYSGAELANLLNEAAIIAVHAESAVITRSHLDQARDKILLGRVRSGVVVSDEERRLIALHEAGHAIVGIITCPEDRLHKVTIEPRGRSLGAAHFAPDTDRHLHSRRYLEGIIAKALGGRAAELRVPRPRCGDVGRGQRPRTRYECGPPDGRRVRDERGGRSRVGRSVGAKRRAGGTAPGRDRHRGARADRRNRRRAPRRSCASTRRAGRDRPRAR